MVEALVYIKGKPKLVDEKGIYSFIKKHRKDIHRDSREGPAICFPNGDEHYYEQGVLHREDGPALSNSSGRKEYYKNGVLHRENGPAVVNKSNEAWYFNGMLHRLDGPAYIVLDGNKFWFLNGKKYKYTQWLKEREKWLKR